mmetsp:Transcript_52916/g.172184  ORF Transcript_52916/g.172184 Transcript_52916/m.172184 type:complete len:81 (+) Transcript_52916:716-958(+)
MEVSPWYGIFFCCYILFVQFAIFSIVTMIFLRDALSAVADERDRYARKLLQLFTAIDTSKDGIISREEFEFSSNDPKTEP